MKNTMKKVLMAVLGFVLVSAFASCSSCDSPSLQRGVEKMQKKIPYEAGEGFTVTSCELLDDKLELVMTYNEEQFNFDDPLFQLGFELMKGDIKESLLSEKSTKELLGLCKKEGKGFSIMLKGEKSEKTMPFFVITPEELQQDDNY